MESNTKDALIAIIGNQSWLTIIEIRAKLHGTVRGLLVRHLMDQLVNDGIVVVRNDGGDGNSRYATKENSDVEIQNYRRPNMLGLPWIKFPDTADGCKQIIAILDSIDESMGISPEYRGQPENFFNQVKGYLEAMSQRLQ